MWSNACASLKSKVFQIFAAVSPSFPCCRTTSQRRPAAIDRTGGNAYFPAPCGRAFSGRVGDRILGLSEEPGQLRRGGTRRRKAEPKMSGQGSPAAEFSRQISAEQI